MDVALYAVPAIDPRSPLYRLHENVDCAGRMLLMRYSRLLSLLLQLYIPC